MSVTCFEPEKYFSLSRSVLQDLRMFFIWTKKAHQATYSYKIAEQEMECQMDIHLFYIRLVAYSEPDTLLKMTMLLAISLISILISTSGTNSTGDTSQCSKWYFAVWIILPVCEVPPLPQRLHSPALSGHRCSWLGQQCRVQSPAL